MSKRYKNVGPLPFRGIAPGDVGTLDLPDAQEARQVRAGRLVIQDAPSRAERMKDPDDQPDATAPDRTTTPDRASDRAPEQEDD